MMYIGSFNDSVSTRTSEWFTEEEEEKHTKTKKRV